MAQNWIKDNSGAVTAVVVTEADLAAAFTEWDRLFREDPEAYESDVARILKGKTIEDYGQACAPFLIDLLARIDDAHVSEAIDRG